MIERWKHWCVFAGMTVVQQGEACQTEEVADEYKGLIWSLVKQVRPGMDLSKVALPTFILEPRSFLDKLSDYYYHVDFLSEWVFWFVFQVWDYHYTWSLWIIHYLCAYSRVGEFVNVVDSSASSKCKKSYNFENVKLRLCNSTWSVWMNEWMND